MGTAGGDLRRAKPVTHARGECQGGLKFGYILRLSQILGRAQWHWHVSPARKVGGGQGEMGLRRSGTSLGLDFKHGLLAIAGGRGCGRLSR